MKAFITVIVAALIIWGAIALARNQSERRASTNTATSTLETSGQSTSIEQYVRNNINELSPASTSLGGTFYVTEIQTNNGTGTVSYEDGHNAYTADFTYDSTLTGTSSIKTFEIRE